MSLTRRPALLTECDFIARVEASAHPADPEDPTLLRHWLLVSQPGWTCRYFILSAPRRGDVGYIAIRRPGWTPGTRRGATVGVELLPESRSEPLLGDALRLAEAIPDLYECEVFLTRSYDDDHQKLAVLSACGYRPAARITRWEIDLERTRSNLLDADKTVGRSLRARGLEFVTLAESAAPEKMAQLRRLRETLLDEGSPPRLRPRQDKAEFEAWIGAPGVDHQRVWVAQRGPDVIGVSVLQYAPSTGIVSTYWTAVLPNSRGLGIATALKVRTLLQARTLGIRRVRSETHEANAPVLRMNTRLGYSRRSNAVEFARWRDAPGPDH